MVARKRFGQHFLHDSSVIGRIIDLVHALPENNIIEIGPGRGAITDGLVNSGCNLRLVEIDRDLVLELKKKYGGKLEILTTDALKLNYGNFGNCLRVIGNLPYNISSPILFKLFGYVSHIEDMIFMLQKEVVDRICAPCGTKNYGRLSIMSQYYCTAEKMFDVAPEAFSPQPKVNSAVIKLIPHDNPDRSQSLICLKNIVTGAFSQRRKTIRNALKPWLNQEQLASIGIDTTLRPEELSLKDFIKCADLVWELQQK
ncbi:MAG: 16S rRNA (adenine(1518)-N(6)/adenine(1519)-N(6))-dimethyltransferase RsmA [Candidatus Azotimanducaceae bacterium]|uniref:Ribosomal RNA small subunit methyltransferase A n=1 Tax=OM182 bacterium TaxID=2510334 RepID=A0A520S3K3_9GAMM|nr:MAG: 16S rRNA (adenine(1518)-N(6)/adenine(1519)-N(6))-dimethyltransferase RsmA [OM182 bacterium]